MILRMLFEDFSLEDIVWFESMSGNYRLRNILISGHSASILLKEFGYSRVPGEISSRASPQFRQQSFDIQYPGKQQ